MLIYKIVKTISNKFNFNTYYIFFIWPFLFQPVDYVMAPGKGYLDDGNGLING